VFTTIISKIALLILVSIGWFYALSPKFLRYTMASFVGFFPYIFKMRRAVIKQNLQFAFPDDQQKQSYLLKKAYRHLGFLFFEVAMVLTRFGAMSYFVKKNVKIIGLEHWKEALKKEKGIIFLSSHIGSWEIMAAAGASSGIDTVIVTKRIKPAWLHEALERGRLKFGVRAAYEPKTLSTVLKQLAKKQTVGFVLDQYAGPPIGIRVPLFGIPVGTAGALAAVAKRTGAIVLPTVNYRDWGGDFILEIQSPVQVKEPIQEGIQEVAQLTALYVSYLEKHIYAHPDQWLWTHRRFKGDLSPIRKDEWNESRARR